MNPLTRFADTVRSYWYGPLTTRDPALADALGLGPTSTGVMVNSDTAFNSSAFWSAVAIIAGDVASVPLEVMKRDKAGNNEPFVDSKTYQLVHDTPNPEMGSMVFREALQSHALTWGNAYAEIERDGAGRPAGLWPITPDRVVPFRQDRRVKYRIRNIQQGDTILEAGDVLHVPGLGFDGLIGYSVIEKARDSISMGLAIQRFGGSFFGNGATFGGVLSHPQNLTKEVKQGIRESIDAVHGGVDRAHKFVILGGGMTYTKLGIPPNDAQFLESRRFEVEEIARWFHMPQHKLNGLDHATFSNIEHLDLEYYKGCLRGWYVRWEQEYKRKLIPPLEWKYQYFRHNVEGFLRGDTASRATFYKDMFGIGVYSQNMILELENQNGIGPDGDAHYVAANMMPIERALNPPTPPAVTVTDVTPPADQKVLPAPKRDDETDAEFRALLSEIAAHQKALEDTFSPERALTLQGELTRLTDERDRLQRQFDEQAATHAAAVEALAADVDHAKSETVAERTAREAAEARARIASAKHAKATGHITAAHAARAEADSTRQGIEVKLEEALAQAALVEARAAALAEESVAAKAALEAQRAVDTARLSGMLPAIRALIVDAMGRMVRRETEKARRHQATPEKLRSWAADFYALHEDTCLEALRPAIRAHLAWKQSAEDVDAVALVFVRAHVTESQRQLRAIADGDPDELPAILERTLTRWEQQRPEALADQILADELVYVRSL